MTRTTSFTTRCRSVLSGDARGEAFTRRDFVRCAAGLVALPHLPFGVAPSQEFAYVASGDGSLHVFLARGERWTRIQQVTSRATACVLLSPDQTTLYVANDVEEHEGKPRGTVEAFHVDPRDGRLSLSSRQALSLSATRPRHMAISPDGKLLAVATYGGGIYNLLPISPDGSLRPPSAIFKDAGCGPCATAQASAHPHTLFFEAGGDRLLSSDFGSDRLSVFVLEDGRLRRQTLRSTGEGSGPGAWVLNPAGSFVYAWHDLEGALACYRYQGGTVGEMIQQLSFADSAPNSSPGAVAIHPSGRMLYIAQGVWRIDAQSGRLEQAQDILRGASTIVVARSGESVYLLDGGKGSIDRLSAASDTGELHSRIQVAAVNQPKSLAVKSIRA